MEQYIWLISIAFNMIIGIIGYLLHRAIAQTDKKLDSLAETIDMLERAFHDHKVDDHQMAVAIATLTANKDEHMRALQRLEDTLEDVRKAL